MSTAATSQNKKEADKFKDLIGPMDPKLDREVREKLITARVGLLLRASFFGNLATRLKLVNADEWCGTAATDGRHFYYNSRFIDMLKPKEVEFLFGHEVLHCVYDHFGRRGDRDPMLFNVANDYAVNGDLKKHRVGEFITSVPCLYDSKYEGKSSEEIYDDLYENAEKINMSDLIDKLLDDHLDGEGDSDSDSDDDGDEKDGRGKKPKLSAEERQKIKDEIKEAVLAAAAASDGAGNLPAGVRRLIQDMTAPKMNWREFLRMQLESTIKSDFTWMRASRRGWHMDAIMPGMKNDEMIDIAISIDASGSMGADILRDILSETQGIMDSFPAYKLHVISFDTKVYNPATYDSENLDNLVDYEIHGGGGTDFDCVFEYFKENDIQPKRHIMFTDGYPFGSWGDENYCDTVFIIHGNTNVVPPWGQHAYYEKEKAHV
jgi:predicted metal-dependent peptidase